MVGNSSRTCLAIPAASLKSNEMICAKESVESNRFPLTSTDSNFFELLFANCLHEVRTLLSSFLLIFSRIEMLLLRFWPRLLVLVINWFFSLAYARMIQPFYLTCFVVFLRCVFYFGTTCRPVCLIHGVVLVRNPGDRDRVPISFSFPTDILMLKSG